MTRNNAVANRSRVGHCTATVPPSNQDHIIDYECMAADIGQTCTAPICRISWLFSDHERPKLMLRVKAALNSDIIMVRVVGEKNSGLLMQK